MTDWCRSCIRICKITRLYIPHVEGQECHTLKEAKFCFDSFRHAIRIAGGTSERIVIFTPANCQSLTSGFRTERCRFNVRAPIYESIITHVEGLECHTSGKLELSFVMEFRSAIRLNAMTAWRKTVFFTPATCRSLTPLSLNSLPIGSVSAFI